MLYRHANVQQNVLTFLMADDVHEDFPALLIQVKLEKMIETAISCDLELRTHTETCALLFCDDDGLNDTLFVAFQIKSPLAWHMVSSS